MHETDPSLEKRQRSSRWNSLLMHIHSRTWSYGWAPERCHPPCHSQRLHEPSPCTACTPPRPWPWPPHHAAKRTVPFSASSLALPIPSAHGRGMGSGWFQDRPDQCPPPPLFSLLSSAVLVGLACHPVPASNFSQCTISNVYHFKLKAYNRAEIRFGLISWT